MLKHREVGWEVVAACYAEERDELYGTCQRDDAGAVLDGIVRMRGDACFMR